MSDLSPENLNNLISDVLKNYYQEKDQKFTLSPPDNILNILDDLSKFKVNLITADDMLKKESNFMITSYSSKEKKTHKKLEIMENNSGSRYVELQLQPDFSMKLYINIDDEIEDGKVMYDYFGCGEVFVNTNTFNTITSGSGRLIDLMKVTFSDNTSPLRLYPTDGELFLLKDPSEPTLKAAAEEAFLVKAVFRTNSNTLGWLFDTAVFFNTEQTTITYQAARPDTPMCKFFSQHKEGSQFITSPEYKLANHIPNLRSCCSPIVTSTVAVCTYSSDEQNACLAYSPMEEVLVDISVKVQNTTDVEKFAIKYFMSTNNNHVFTIYNLANNSTLNTLSYPNSISYEECCVEVKKVAEEYMTCYEDVVIEQHVEAEENEIKKSFIESILMGV
jgi:hypothetical protein